MWKYACILCTALSLSLNAEVNVLAFAGSTGKDSVNKKLAAFAASIATKDGARVTLIDLKDYALPLYDADFEKTQGMPKSAVKLRELMIKNEIIFIASPEYNDSVSGVLKNAIDWASRNETAGASRDAFKGKTFLIMSASPSPKGGINGLSHLRAIIESVGGTVVSKGIAVPKAYSAFDEQGHLKDPELNRELTELIHEILTRKKS